MRIAVINRDLCNPGRCNLLCIRVCPINKFGEKAIEEDNGQPVINEDVCTGCGICVKRCPFAAIKIVNLPEARGRLVHRYGKNGFALFNLPAPGDGPTAIIGRNGLGKSTAAKILAGKIKANGEELPAFWRKWMQKRLVLKPQQISKLRQPIKVSRVAEEWALDKGLLKAFHLDRLLDRSLEVLSGGELQRLALAIAFSRQADLYLVDEPSTFLDIAERINVARFLASKPALIIDHDLSFLDIASDYAYVVYGEPGVYGVFSEIKASATAINEFLAGYLKAENVRIRDSEIRIEMTPSEPDNKILFEYPAFEKQLGEFRLRAESGSIRNREIIGLVGPNGIGKTTMIRSIAENDETAVKPQEFDAPEETLGAFLKGADLQEVVKDGLKAFGLHRLLEVPLNHLSWGQVQMAMVIKTMALDRRVYLLDEPSAFLDVEARLRLVTFLKRSLRARDIALFVVDHDLLFLDALVNRLVVFDGVPGQRGHASAPMDRHEGFNQLLRALDITIRRDAQTNRPRINKPGSVLDRQQRQRGEYFK